MLFGQFALAAYACAAPRPVTPAVMAHAMMDTEAGQVPCSAMMLPADAPQANACEVHCTDGATSLVPPDWPQVTLAALPVPALALAQLATVDGRCANAVGPVARRSAADRPLLPSPDLIPTLA